MHNTLEVSIAVLSKVGGRKRNEDSCGHWATGGQICCVLSDGAGGHGGGDVASRLAVDSVLSGFQAAPEVSPQKAAELIELANQEVIAHQGDRDELQDMRATLVVLLINEHLSKAAWAHIGDSRLYAFRGGSQFYQTKDHSVFQSMIDAGYVKPSSARESSQRTILTGSLGGEEGFTPDVTEALQGVQSGDAYLLCSDGFWEYVSESDMERLMQRVASPQDWLEQMELELLANKREGHDNYSAIAIWYGAMDFVTRIGG
jgi:PPM family protein phosphatase